MGLTLLEKELEPVYNQLDALEFSNLLLACRLALGIKQYKAAEIAGCSKDRLKNLETGYFREMPSMVELQALGALFDIKFSILEQKAKVHVESRIRHRKVRVIPDEEEM